MIRNYTTFFGSIIMGYFYCGLSGNLYTIGYRNPFCQPFDYSLNLINAFGSDEKTKQTIQMLKLMRDAIENKGNYDVMDWLLMGTHFAKNAEEETSYQAFYIAHLLEH